MTKTNNAVMIVESVNASALTQVTSSKYNVPEGMMLVEGVLGVAGVKNRNNRYYTLEEYQRHVDDFNIRIQESNGILGEMEHPKSMNIDLNNISHKVMEVWVDDFGTVKGKLLLLDTPKGQIAQSVVKSGSPLPVSSRAMGKVDGKTGKTVLEYLSTWDLVGTSGFAQANVKQISESLEVGESQIIVESMEVNLDQTGSIINENSTGEYVHISEIKAIVENLLAEALPIMESAKDQKEELDIAVIDERFENVYGVAIEKWIVEEYTHKILEGVQGWITKEFVPHFGNVLEGWITNEFAPVVESWTINEFAPMVESWTINEFAPVVENWTINEFAPVLENWTINEFAPMVESWTINEFAPVLENWTVNEFAPMVESWTINEFAPVVETWTTKEFAPMFGSILESYQSETGSKFIGESKDEEVTETEKEEEVKESEKEEEVTEAKRFTSSLLDKVNSIVNEAKQIEKPETPTERVDESMFIMGPNWLRKIPQRHKQTWQALNESQQDEVYRRASIRTIRTDEDINVFWDAINFHTLLENKIPNTIDRKEFVQVNENQNSNPRNRISAIAQAYRK